MSSDQSIRFEGFQSPNTTPIPDQLFDELLPVLSGAELKVLLYICRRTFGFKKDSDNISLNQMLHGISRKDGTQLDAGVGLSKPTLLRALKSLAAKQIVITERRESAARGNEATNYRLHVQRPPLGKKMSLGWSQNFTKSLVKKSYPQETGNKKQLDNTVNGFFGNEPIRAAPAAGRSHKAKAGVAHPRSSPLWALPDIDRDSGEVEHVAQSLVEALGDEHSRAFYRLVARKVPDQRIWQALSEIRQDGANHPPKVFNYRMNRHAAQELGRIKGQIGSARL